MQDLSRRSVLGLGAGLALSPLARPALNQNPAAPDPGAKRSIQKAVKLYMVEVEGSLEEKFRAVKEAGFDGIELDSPGGATAEEVLSAKRATGLEVPGVVDSVHWSKPFSHPEEGVRAEAVVALEQALRDCKAYGGSQVLVVPGVVNQETPYDLAWERSREAIGSLVPLAEELDIRIAFENVWNHFLLSPMEAARYVDSFESAHVGWFFDVGNVVNYGWPEQWIRILGKRILRLDVKEFSRKKRDEEGLWKGFGVKIGEGDCGWGEVRKALADIEYEGWAVAEVGGGDQDWLRDVAERMDRVLGLPG